MKTKTKGRRFLSIFLTLCMVIGLCVEFKTTAKAYDALPAAFSQLEGKANYDAATGAITLTDNVTLTTTIDIPSGTFSIDLAGYIIDSPTRCFRVITHDVNLTFKDSSSEYTGTVRGGEGALYIQPGNNNIVTIESGTYISESTRGNAAVHAGFNDTGSLNISGGIFKAKTSALVLQVLSSSNIKLTGGYYQINDTNGGGGSINIWNDKRTIASVIPSSSHVSLNGAAQVAVEEATELQSSQFTGTIRILDPTAVPTPDSDQESTIKATVIDNVQPPVSVPTYTTTIPAEINLGTLKKSNTESIKSAEFEVKVADVKNMNGKQVNVSISTTDGNFNLKKGTDTLPFKVFNKTTGGTALNSGNTFATFTEDKTVTGRVEVDQNDITALGNYSGTVKFSIALEDRVN